METDMQKVAFPDALDAMERNIKVFMGMAGLKRGYVRARIDVHSGTAGIRHIGDSYGARNVDGLFPALIGQTMLTTAELDWWTGYFLPERCHALYTSEIAWAQAVSERLHKLVNALEDIRIETKLNAAGIVGNSRHQLNALLDWVVNELPANYDPND